MRLKWQQYYAILAVRSDDWLIMPFAPDEHPIRVSAQYMGWASQSYFSKPYKLPHPSCRQALIAIQEQY